MSFNAMRDAVNAQLAYMTENSTELYTVELDKDALYDTYLKNYPAGTNPPYRERTEHDCSCCRNFIRNIGNVIAIVDGQLVTVWDIDIANFRQGVANALSLFVREHSDNIENVYRHWEERVGTSHNFEPMPSGEQKKWEHFYFDLPAKFVKAEAGSYLSETRANKEVLERSIRDIALDACELVNDLIAQGSLYRGDEFKPIVEAVIAIKTEFSQIEALDDRLKAQLFFWERSIKLGQRGRFRNTVIGTLLADISEGRELEEAVKSYEAKVAPENYKRPTALITQKQIDEANATIVELGYEDSLHRRPARLDDITVDNVLFADRDARKKMKGNALDLLTPTKAAPKANFDKVEEMNIDDFIANVLPKATSLEVMMENRHTANLVSLVAPVYPDAPCMLEWANNYSWSYNGELADSSIKQLVKGAGGNTDADARASLAWFNGDDLDLSIQEPSGNLIYFGSKRSYLTGGFLDVDMNANGVDSRTPVENIAYKDRAKMKEGRYKVLVKNFRLRERIDFGFVLEFEHLGTVNTYEYKKSLADSQTVVVLEFDYSHSKGFTIVNSIEGSELSRTEWGVTTQQWTKVSMLLNSPNYWDGEQTRNKHVFFMLDGCKTTDKIRGFYNEFLSPELTKHRKVFEALGSKLKADPTDDQLSGLGFSSTMRNDLLVKVSGSFNRVIKVTF